MEHWYQWRGDLWCVDNVALLNTHVCIRNMVSSNFKLLLHVLEQMRTWETTVNDLIKHLTIEALMYVGIDLFRDRCYDILVITAFASAYDVTNGWWNQVMTRTASQRWETSNHRHSSVELGEEIVSCRALIFNRLTNTSALLHGYVVTDWPQIWSHVTKNMYWNDIKP